jgi:hypothetical protein
MWEVRVTRAENDEPPIPSSESGFGHPPEGVVDKRCRVIVGVREARQRRLENGVDRYFAAYNPIRCAWA